MRDIPRIVEPVATPHEERLNAKSVIEKGSMFFFFDDSSYGSTILSVSPKDSWTSAGKESVFGSTR